MDAKLFLAVLLLLKTRATRAESVSIELANITDQLIKENPHGDFSVTFTPHDDAHFAAITNKNTPLRFSGCAKYSKMTLHFKGTVPRLLAVDCREHSGTADAMYLINSPINTWSDLSYLAYRQELALMRKALMTDVELDTAFYRDARFKVTIRLGNPDMYIYHPNENVMITKVVWNNEELLKDTHNAFVPSVRVYRDNGVEKFIDFVTYAYNPHDVEGITHHYFVRKEGCWKRVERSEYVFRAEGETDSPALSANAYPEDPTPVFGTAFDIRAKNDALYTVVTSTYGRVPYREYAPQQPTLIQTVTDGDKTILELPCGETLKKIILYQRKFQPIIVQIVLNKHDDRKIVREGDVWTAREQSEAVDFLNTFLDPPATNIQIDIADFPDLTDYHNYFFKVADNDKLQAKTYYLKPTYLADKISDGDQTIWQPKHEGEACTEFRTLVIKDTKHVVLTVETDESVFLKCYAKGETWEEIVEPGKCARIENMLEEAKTPPKPAPENNLKSGFSKIQCLMVLAPLLLDLI